MLILRTILETKEENNQELGSNYRIVKKNDSEDKFNDMLAFVNVNSEYEKEVYAVVSASDSSVHIPLFNRNKYYIMTDSGKTFANLSN
jgi:hypothetical protein